MAGFEEQLNAILGDPSAMDQIMSLARSLTGETESREEDPTQAPPVPDLSQLTAGIDPALLRAGATLLAQQGEGDKSGELLEALRPFLKEDRRDRLDRAREILRMGRMLRVAMEAAGRGGGQENV